MSLPGGLIDLVHEPLTPTTVTAAMALTAVWVVALPIFAVLAKAVARPHHRRRRIRLQVPGVARSVSAALVGAASVTSAALPATAAATATDATSDLPPLPHEQTDPNGHVTGTPRPTAAAPASGRSTATATTSATTPSARAVWTVRKGDTLSGIAQHRLGDADRWPEIWDLNRGRRFPHVGGTFTNPDLIYPGWTLNLPATASTSPAQRPPRPNPPPPAAAETGTTAEVPDPAPPPADTAPPRPATVSPHTTAPTEVSAQDGHRDGVTLPSRGWVSLGLATAIASVATLLRLQHRRRARLSTATPATTAPQPTPVPPSLTPLDTVGHRHLDADIGEGSLSAAQAVPAPVGLNADGGEVSLFDLPGPGVALHGDGAVSAARGILAATLTSGTVDAADTRPVAVTTADLLARLLPHDVPTVGLDPDGTAYDGERLIVLADTAAAITHAEEEMVGRRRLLDTFETASIADLNARTDHAETQPPYVLLIDAEPQYAARVHAVAAHRAALDLHPIVLGHVAGVPGVEVTADGTVTGDTPYPVARLSTLGEDDLAAVLAMLTDAMARPEPGTDVDDPPAEPTPAAAIDEVEPVPFQRADAAALVKLRVLGPVTAATEAGPVTTGMRSGSYTVFALLAAHPAGRTLDQLAAAMHPGTDPTVAVKRVRTDITSARRVLRTATGRDEPMFIVYDPATGLYRLDPATVAVDLWQMLTAIDQAMTTDDDMAALAALRQATNLYGGDFADGHDHAGAVDYATSYRHQILTAYARIAEILESDHPDQAVAALERAVELDPVNEELYQRIMRIHGRQHRPDAVRRTLRRLEQRLADLLDAEPSQATRRVAERQLRPTATVRGGQP